MADLGNRRRPQALLLLLGALAYTVWLAEGLVLAGELDPITSYVSELSATDQPRSWLFRGTDVIAGLLFASAAVVALWPMGPREGANVGGADEGHSRISTVAWIALLMFGLATVADAANPLSCAATQDLVCAARETAGQVPLTHKIHSVTSVVATVGSAVTVVLFTVLACRSASVARQPILLAAVAHLVLLGWCLVEISFGGRDSALGLAQRLSLWALACWLVLLAITIGVRLPQRLGRAQQMSG